MNKVACMLLAAGSASRFGGKKQLASVNAQPMVQHTLSELKALFHDDLYIVIGAYADEIRPYVASNASVIENTVWESGMGSSISHGVSVITGQSHYAGIMVALVDQVALQMNDYKQLYDSFDGNNIVACQYHAVVGVPAIFPKTLFGQLRNLSGEQGARMIIQQHSDRVTTVSMPSAGLDIDTKQDLREFQELNNATS